MDTPEVALGVAIANALETQFFNPATLGGYLANQPLYTSDRLMELVAWIIEKQAQRHLLDKNTTSEGLWFAGELDKAVNQLQVDYVFDSLRLPNDNRNKKFIDSLPEPSGKGYEYDYLNQGRSSLPDAVAVLGDFL